jgi:ABC-2 type transport system ATP-binding protein
MIVTKNLSKHYGPLVAVDGISFEVKAGEVLGFLGPNGAGKSTTMKMITGFLAPTDGTVSVCGIDVQEHPVETKRRMGYLPEGAPGYGEMTPMAFLDFVADIRGLEGDYRRQRTAYVIEHLHLERVLHQPIETLSKGFRRRVGLAQAIIHDPDVLILDEPTDGLDPNQKHEVRTLINNMAADKIIVVSTHILEEVTAVCTRAIIIADGRIVADDTPEGLRERSRYHNAVTMKVDNAPDAKKLLGDLKDVRRVESTEDGHLTALPKDGKVIFPAVSALARDRSWNIVDLQIDHGRLDEVFRDITTEVQE